jgi:formylglycine-generating enzyme required for sulfatase activity
MNTTPCKKSTLTVLGLGALIVAGVAVASCTREVSAPGAAPEGVPSSELLLVVPPDASQEGGATDDGAAGAADGGGPLLDSGPPGCGPDGLADCKEAPLVPGGTFKRGYDGIDTYDRTWFAFGGMDQRWPATVSSFRLDRYEVTVGRFREFVAGYPGNMPAPGSGNNPNNPADPGWDPAWDAKLPATQAELVASLHCSPKWGLATWTDAPGPNEGKPVNCPSWHAAFAFCIWDGGRLPTEAELNYAAAGGDEQRVFPWSVPHDQMVIDHTYASYGDFWWYGVAGYPQKPTSTVERAGSKSPKGDGRWGHADLSGSLFEWVVDTIPLETRAWPYAGLPMPCNDCALLEEDPTWPPGVPRQRGVRNGSFNSYIRPPNPYAPHPESVSTFLVINRGGTEEFGQYDIGARCARSP